MSCVCGGKWLLSCRAVNCKLAIQCGGSGYRTALSVPFSEGAARAAAVDRRHARDPLKDGAKRAPQDIGRFSRRKVYRLARHKGKSQRIEPKMLRRQNRHTTSTPSPES